MRDTVAESLQAVADAAQPVRNGFSGLVQGSQEASTASGESERAFRQMAASIEETGRKSMETKVALESTATATATASQSVSQLRAEYRQLMEAGNLQAAAEKLEEINKIQKALPESAQSAQQAAKAVDEAYTGLDKGKASLQGLKSEVDKTGKSTRDLKDAADKTKGSNDQVTRAVNDQRTALERLNAEREREIAAQEKANELKERELELYRKKWNIDKEGHSLNTAGERVGITILSRTAVLEMAKGQGLDDAAALRVVDQFEQQYDKPAGIFGGIQGGVNPNEVNRAIADAVLQQARDKVAQAQRAPLESPTNTSTVGAAARVIDLRINGSSLGNVRTDADGERAIERLLSELERSKNLSGI